MEHAPGHANDGLQNDHAEIYDRQIRLWGLEAQRKLHHGVVLIIGDTSKLIYHELAKNVLLAGVGTVYICHRPDLKDQSNICDGRGFLGDHEVQFEHSLKDMNPLVRVNQVIFDLDHGIKIVPSEDQTKLADLTKKPNVVCFIGHILDPFGVELSKYCRSQGSIYIAGTSFGMLAAFLSDAGDKWSFSLESRRFSATTESIKTETQTISFPSFAQIARSVVWTQVQKRSVNGFFVIQVLDAFLEKFQRLPCSSMREEDKAQFQEVVNETAIKYKMDESNMPKELLEICESTAEVHVAPVATILGGVWAREVIKFVTEKDQPINNFFIFNGRTLNAPVELVLPSALI